MKLKDMRRMVERLDEANPKSGDGYYYLIRAGNPCSSGDLGPGTGREILDALTCP